MEMSESGDDEVSKLLHSWGLSDLKAKFKANYIVLQALEYLTEDDIVELIPKIGQRAIFRGRLLQWRQQNGITKTAPPPQPPPPLKVCKLEAAPNNTPTDQQTETSTPKPASPIKIKHKLFGTLTKCMQKPKCMQPSTGATSKSAIQSKVQQFYISPIGKAPPPPTPAPPPIPSIPVVPKADLTPFVTSIIRVDTTDCQKTYTKNTNPKTSPAIPQSKGGRTTILQKLSTSKRASGTSSPNSVSQDSLENRKKDAEEQVGEEEQPEPSHLYPIVKLETEMADTNWNEYSEPEQEPEQEPLKIPKKEKEDEVMADSTDFQADCGESMESDSAPDFDSENENSGGQLDQIIPEPSKTRRKREKRLGKLDIRSVLMNSDMGRHVLNYYESNERLDIGRRRMLIDAIVQYCWITNRRISPKDCCDMAEEIIELLPNERMEDYYLSQAGKNPKSPLYNKYRNMHRRFFIEKGLPLPMRKKKKSHLSLAVDDIEVDDSFIIS